MEKATLISRAEAKKQGLVRYFTGEPCLRGHVAERTVPGRQCVVCLAAYREAYYSENKGAYKERSDRRYAEKRDHVLAVQQSYRDSKPQALLDRRAAYNNSEAGRESGRRHYAKHRGSVLERQREYVAANPEKAVAKRALRRARQRRAVPPWFAELDELVWLEAADLVHRRRAATGIDWAADHMLPLAGRLVSGLHVASNCQVIPAILNSRKHSKMVLTQPLEWVAQL